MVWEGKQGLFFKMIIEIFTLAPVYVIFLLFRIFSGYISFYAEILIETSEKKFRLLFVVGRLPKNPSPIKNRLFFEITMKIIGILPDQFTGFSIIMKIIGISQDKFTVVFL